MLGYELKTPPPNPKMIKIVGQKSKFVMLDDIPDSDIVDADVTPKKEHYGFPGSSNDHKNTAMATSPLEENVGVSSHKIVVSLRMETLQKINTSNK